MAASLFLSLVLLVAAGLVGWRYAAGPQGPVDVEFHVTMLLLCAYVLSGFFSELMSSSYKIAGRYDQFQLFGLVSKAVEIGVLHDADTRLADALLAALPGTPPQVDRNQPYGPEHGVTHTLKRHALPANRLNVMLEVRNDLIADDAGVERIGALLAPALKQALAETGQGAAQ